MPFDAEQQTAVDAAAGGRILNAGLTPEDLHPIDGPEDHPDNPREGDIGAISELIREHGWYGRLIVQRATPEGEPRNRLVAGHHRRQAAKALGYVRLPMEFIVCSDRVAKKLVLADNRATDLASYRKDKLAQLLQEFAQADDLEGTGYVGDDLEQLLFELRGAGDDGPGVAAPGDTGADDVGEGEPARDPVGAIAPRSGRTVAVGDVWELAAEESPVSHVLFCCDVFLGWPEWKKRLRDPELDVFCPFPGPHVAVSSAAERNRLVMVQPDPELAAQLLDLFAAAHGERSVELVDSAGGPRE